MKKIAFLILLLFAFTSCEQDELIDASSYQEENNTGISAKGNNSKIDVCHKGKVINISINAIQAHQGHGDAVDLDGDGYFDIENDCSGTDCDNSDPSVNPGSTEVVYNGVDDDCDPGTPDDDLDGDGYGIEEDCDDEDPDVNPGVEEICDNGIDDDCNGLVDEDCTPDIGEHYLAGVVFYIFQPGDIGYIEGETHGLMCALTDQYLAEWGCYFVQDPDIPDEWPPILGTLPDIGTGAENTALILSVCTLPGIAARVSDDYSVTVDGVVYDDWFLPSKDELHEMIVNRDLINTTSLNNGGTAMEGDGEYYWSSTQYFNSTEFAWAEDISIQWAADKDGSYWIRSVRFF